MKRLQYAGGRSTCETVRRQSSLGLSTATHLAGYGRTAGSWPLLYLTIYLCQVRCRVSSGQGQARFRPAITAWTSQVFLSRDTNPLHAQHPCGSRWACPWHLSARGTDRETLPWLRPAAVPPERRRPGLRPRSLTSPAITHETVTGRLVRL